MTKRHSSLLLLLLSIISTRPTSSKSNYVKCNRPTSILRRGAVFGGNRLGVAIRRGCHYNDDDRGLLSALPSSIGSTTQCSNVLDPRLEVEYNPEDNDGIRTMIHAAVVRNVFEDPVMEDDDEEEIITRGALPFPNQDYGIIDVGSTNIKMRVQSVMRRCYMSSPSAVYFNSPSENIAQTQQHHRQTNGVAASMVSSITTKPKPTDPKQNAATSPIPPMQTPPTTPSTTSINTNIDETTIEEPSPAILSGITQPIVSNAIWSRLTGREFHFPSVLKELIQMGIRTASPQSAEYIDWKPADAKTKQLFQEYEEGSSNEALRRALEEEMAVFVWTGTFRKDGYGAELPVVRTVSIVPMSPRKMAELLMDSDRVKTYNKMSLGRKDVITLPCDDGEAKIVRNLTQPPVSKKLMEFVTLMCARPFNSEDNVGVGIMGGSSPENVDDDSGDGSNGYIVMSRAVSGGRWSSGNTASTTQGNDSDDDSKQKEPEMKRSEILLGVNLLREIPGQPDKTELTAVTHVKAGAPGILAVKIGIRGAVNFVRDIRSLCE